MSDERWSRRSVAAAALFLFVLGVQVGIPLLQLRAPRPARFGWQMFTAITRPTRYTLVFHDGTRKPADLASHIARSRGEMSLARALPPHLCRVVPDLAAVEVLAPDARVPQVHRCR